MGIKESKTIPYYWNRWHTNGNREYIFFEILTQEFGTIFDYIFQEIPTLKLLNISIIQGKYVISIYQKYHIIKILLNNIG